MASNIKNPSDDFTDAYLTYLASRHAPRRKITMETIGWSLVVAVTGYMLFVAVAGILYAG